MTNLGAKLVEYTYELRKQWLPIHQYLYSRGMAILSDEQYDVRYQGLEIDMGKPGAPLEMPEIPKYALYSEEAKAFDVPLWDHMAEYRRRVGD